MWSVCVSNVLATFVRGPEACKNGWTDRDAAWASGADWVGPMNHMLHWGAEPQGEGAILGVVRPSQKHWQSLLRCLLRKGSFNTPGKRKYSKHRGLSSNQQPRLLDNSFYQNWLTIYKHVGD